MNKTEANRFCFKGYSGLNCEIISVEMQANKRNIQIIVAITITSAQFIFRSTPI